MNHELATIIEIIVDVTDIPSEDIKPESSLIDDLDLSSIEIVAIISKLEIRYRIKVNEDDLLSVETVEDILRLVTDN